MAARRRKVQRPATKARLRKEAIIVALFALVVAIVGICLYINRQEDDQEQQMEQDARAKAEDSLRREVESRREAAEERSRQKAEEARRQESIDKAAQLAQQQEQPDKPEAAEPRVQKVEKPVDKQKPVEKPQQPEMPVAQEAADAEPTESPDSTADAPSSPEDDPDGVSPKNVPVGENKAESPYDGEFSLFGSVRAEDKRWWNEKVEKAIRSGQIEEFAQSLDKRIADVLPELFSGERFKQSVYRNSVKLSNAVEFCYIVKALGNKQIKELIKKKDGSAFLIWMMTDKNRVAHRFLQAFVLNSGELESLPHALSTLYTIKKQAPNEWEFVRYMNLAIACALVHPEIVKKGCKIAHNKDVVMSMQEVFEFYRSRDSARMGLPTGGGLRGAYDLKKMGVSTLLHIVDARLPLSEFEWAHRKIILSRDKWPTLFATVPLNLENATRDHYAYGERTFEIIREKGGLSGDRAYYTATTAKCAGIPAVIITGDGVRGEQSWAGIMVSQRSWVQAGSPGYNTGYFINPCSNKKQHESSLLNQDRSLSEERMGPAADAMLFSDYLALCDKMTEAVNAAHYVCAAFPKYMAGWRHCFDVMETAHAKNALSIETWTRFQQEVDRNSGKSYDLIDLSQEMDVKYVMVHMRDAVKIAALKRAYKRLTTPLTGRVDMLMDCVKRLAQIYVESDKKRDVVSLYRQLFREHKANTHIYALLVAQCATLFDRSESDSLKMLAREADVNIMKQLFNSDDYCKCKKDVEVMRAIAKLYSMAGDDDRFVRLEREVEEKVEECNKRVWRNSYAK